MSDESKTPPRTASDVLPTELEASGDFNQEGDLLRDHVFLVLRSDEGRRVVELLDDQDLVVGRGEDCDVVVSEAKVSRRHFIVKRHGNLLALEDLGSTNGTKLNGMAIRSTERRLVGGDVIRVGRTTMTVAAAAGSGVLDSPATSRLELELGRLAAAGSTATLLRIDLPPDVDSASLDKVAATLNRVALVEPREEGQYAALLEGDHEAVAQAVKEIVPGAEITVARYPLDGESIATLLKAAARAQSDEDVVLEHGVCVADPGMVKVFRVARRLARTDTTVLVLGETGVGKEVLAEQIHRYSGRADKPYVRLNCASLPETLLSSELFGHERGAFTGADRRKTGYFEAADGGTLLLDEIGELSLGMQVKLLRVLESRTVLRLGGTAEIPVNVRVICATHRDLQKEVEAGRFREDLYYRVSAFTLQVPPLRDRPTEIGLLAEMFVRQHGERMGAKPPLLSDAVVGVLQSHRWPGNVRELRNAVEHALVMCDGDTILPEHLPEALRTPESEPRDSSGQGTVRDKLAQIERASILKALADEGGNQTRAAKRLGMSRRALIYKMGKYTIKSKKP
jgi:two-component system, NtrC family, response regulator AtoC